MRWRTPLVRASVVRRRRRRGPLLARPGQAVVERSELVHADHDVSSADTPKGDGPARHRGPNGSSISVEGVRGRPSMTHLETGRRHHSPGRCCQIARTGLCPEVCRDGYELGVDALPGVILAAAGHGIPCHQRACARTRVVGEGSVVAIASFPGQDVAGGHAKPYLVPPPQDSRRLPGPPRPFVATGRASSYPIQPVISRQGTARIPLSSTPQARDAVPRT